MLEPHLRRELLELLVLAHEWLELREAFGDALANRACLVNERHLTGYVAHGAATRRASVARSAYART
jgi:hypothetical protein